MILDIVSYPDPRLSLISMPVSGISDDLRTLVADMFETMYAFQGVGLAAPQIGRLLRVIVMNPVPRESLPAPRVFVNPVLKPVGEQTLSEQEGCLSVPLNYRADVLRYPSVFVTAIDLAGNSIAEMLSGFPAIVLQHEVDHLDGVLFINHISTLRRSLYDAKVKKWLIRKSSV
ncbi:MAG: peptide deformylase [Desulfovibrio sp.]|jgi:peptide deformylase|nr:peptide deformylase [Desulfovibrio sp.]